MDSILDLTPLQLEKKIQAYMKATGQENVLNTPLRVILSRAYDAIQERFSPSRERLPAYGGAGNRRSGNRSLSQMVRERLQEEGNGASAGALTPLTGNRRSPVQLRDEVARRLDRASPLRTALRERTGAGMAGYTRSPRYSGYRSRTYV